MPCRVEAPIITFSFKLYLFGCAVASITSPKIRGKWIKAGRYFSVSCVLGSRKPSRCLLIHFKRLQGKTILAQVYYKFEDELVNIFFSGGRIHNLWSQTGWIWSLSSIMFFFCNPEKRVSLCAPPFPNL